MKIRNADAHTYTRYVLPFEGSNLYAAWQPDGLYVVFSYGPHWPLFIYNPATREWLENSDRTSRTTSKHRGQAHPRTETTPLPVETMLAYVEGLSHAA